MFKDSLVVSLISVPPLVPGGCLQMVRKVYLPEAVLCWILDYASLVEISRQRIM